MCSLYPHHDVQIACESEEGRSLLVRRCHRDGSATVGWDVDLVESGVHIDESLRRDILGARRKVVFVEGQENSLDKLLYSLILPDVTIISKGGCVEVEKAVVGTNETASLNWIKAFGIIDNDRRSEAEIQALKERNVFALPIYTIESIYYHPETFRLLAERISPITGMDHNEAITTAERGIVDSVQPHVERLSQRVSEKRARDILESRKPDSAAMSNQEQLVVTIDIPKIVADEIAELNSAISQTNIEKIISEYPVRETAALDRVATALGFRDRKKYEEAVRKMIADDEVALAHVRGFFGELVFRLSMPQ